MKPGDVVRFANPTPSEEDLRFVVVELRGSRVLVRHDDSPMTMKPVFVYPVADLKIVEGGAMRTYLTEHPRMGVLAEAEALTQAGFKDESWVNDCYPCWIKDNSVRVWIADEKPEDRELACSRYTVETADFDPMTFIEGITPIVVTYAGDDWAEALKMAQVSALAAAFARHLRDYLNPWQMAQVIERNKTREPGVCHSHDFCDANMLMLAAFEEVLQREPVLEDDEDTSLWNAAWDAALQSEFKT